ncbi:MAG: cytochrome c biogenesis protein CcsA [Muribaculum sp.]|nr:cytochrome c biogenesis protein CcsA [Muribaculum sp.]
MSLEMFNILSITALAFWFCGAYFGYKYNRRKAIFLTIAGLMVFGTYIAVRWIWLERPPFSSMGETRMWYAAFLPAIGLFTYIRRHYRLILTLTSVMSAVFICLNISNPLNFNKELAPVLQSPWFVPHVSLYMFAYSMLGTATMMGIYMLLRRNLAESEKIMSDCYNLANTGISFLTLGMLTGAMWANEAWGHYWTWDPKETWAAVTWLTYIIYIHLRRGNPQHAYLGTAILILAFLLLQMCWWGINVIPSFGMGSMHVYS